MTNKKATKATATAQTQAATKATATTDNLVFNPLASAQGYMEHMNTVILNTTCTTVRDPQPRKKFTTSINPVLRERVANDVKEWVDGPKLKGEILINPDLVGIESGLYQINGCVFRVACYAGQINLRKVNPYQGRPNAAYRAIVRTLNQNKPLTRQQLVEKSGVPYSMVSDLTASFDKLGKLVCLTEETFKRYAQLHDEPIQAFNF